MIPCSDCGTTRRKTRIINGDSVCALCEGDRGEHLAMFYPRNHDGVARPSESGTSRSARSLPSSTSLIPWR